MNRVQRFLLIGLGGVAVLIAAGFGAVYTFSEAAIRRIYDVPARPLPVEHTAAALARGQRLAAIYGCTGCHGKDLTGRYATDDPEYPLLHASNLSLRLRDYSDAQIGRAVREGIDYRGRPLWEMPSQGFTAVSDRDMADVVAFLRTVPPKGDPQPAPKFGWHARWVIATGDYEDMPALVREARPKAPIDLGPQYAAARQMVRSACAECHGPDLTGAHEGGKAPDLRIAASYDLEGFRRLMRTGVAADGKERGLMSEVARSRFSNFTDDEIARIHAYLTARAERMP
jgi:cytochrome c553